MWCEDGEYNFYITILFPFVLRLLQYLHDPSL